jgi:hypothetical protein
MVAILTAREKAMKRHRTTTQPDRTDTQSTMVATPEAQAKVAMEKKPLRTTTPQGQTEAECRHGHLPIHAKGVEVLDLFQYLETAMQQIEDNSVSVPHISLALVATH